MTSFFRPRSFKEAALGGSVVICLAVAGLFAVSLAEEPAKPDAKQQEQKKDATADAAAAVLKPAPTPAAEVTDAAKPLVEKMREAYAKLPGLQASGTWAAEWDIDGEKGKESAEFTSSYAAPNKYRHETKGDLQFGSTGDKLYALVRNRYVQNDAPKTRTGVDELPSGAGALLKDKNPSLLLAVTDIGDTPFLAERATKIDKGADVTIDGTTYPALFVSTANGLGVTVALDPSTSLIRRWSADLKKSLEERGQQGVATAVLTIDYARVKPEAPAEPAAFAWAPPEGARDAATMSGDDQYAATQLVGKPAPAFELSDMDGKKVKLADLKGQVVVLDFWATWCGPCRVGMPMLEKAVEARKDQPLKAFAVNREEDKQTVAAFVAESKLKLNVLLDLTGEVAKLYGADEVVPLTVVVGKDGVVKNVMVGIGPDTEAKLAKAFDDALKG